MLSLLDRPAVNNQDATDQASDDLDVDQILQGSRFAALSASVQQALVDELTALSVDDLLTRSNALLSGVTSRFRVAA